MKITIQKTMYLEEVPDEIEENFITIRNRLAGIQQIIAIADQNASEGRFVDASEGIEKIREVLSVLDKNLEEQQSLCLSFERIRIDSQYPQEPHDEQ